MGRRNQPPFYFTSGTDLRTKEEPDSEPEIQATGQLLHYSGKHKNGERIRQYKIEAKVDGKWKTVCTGESVGHKRIEKFDPIEATALRLTVLQSIALPDITNFSAFSVN